MEHSSRKENGSRSDGVVCFQDLLISSESGGASESFFEMANAKVIGYRISPRKNTSKKKANKCKDCIIKVRQENNCQVHTGGIVWETSYLLAAYLEETYLHLRTGRQMDDSKNSSQAGPAEICSPPLGRTLEVGAGCGLLGLVLAGSGLSDNVVLTEATEAMDNLRENVQNNIVARVVVERHIDTRQLRWDKLEEDVAAGGDCFARKFDTIVGTDVVFSTRLVTPLLRTLQRMSHNKTKIYLCIQERCEAAHAELMKEIPRYFKVKDLGQDIKNIPNCQWGSDLECKLFRLKLLKKSKKRKINDETISVESNDGDKHVSSKTEAVKKTKRQKKKRNKVNYE